MRLNGFGVFLIIVLLSNNGFAENVPSVVPGGFVDLAKVDSSILTELRYYTSWNFMGRPIQGYKSNTCFLTHKAADALSNVQKHVESLGYSLLVFDCYRPQKAVNEFVAWSKDKKDLKMQKIFYPQELKDTLFEHGYISSKSGHSRGSTVDLTLVPKNNEKRAGDELRFLETFTDCRNITPEQVPGQVFMGTSYDCFSKAASGADRSIDIKAQENRKLLKASMEKFGFIAYAKEWWHYTLKDEPFKKQYFDFDIKP
ncbi:MAG: M15 family metallopeptidase [Bdellovibrionaceae bacterium]|nr:M15 family metallopeptidase [Pseudobdellovibrionaceae bacterium]